MVVISLDNFSTEILLKIFRYLTIPELCRVKRTCKRFNEIIDTWGNSIVNINPLITNQQDPKVNNRSLRKLSLFDRLRISRNWRLGIYNESARVLSLRWKYIPWLQLERDFLWLSKGGHIQVYKRSGKGVNTKRSVCTIATNSRAEVCRFVKQDNHVLIGQTDGSLRLWSLDGKEFIYQKENSHTADINAVDMCGNIMVSGSRDNSVKIWNKETLPDCHKLDFCDRIWSVAVSEMNNSLLAVGTAGVTSRTAVHIYDMTKQQFAVQFQSDEIGAGVLDLKWESANTLWACGYDTCIRRWDLRSGDWVQTLSDPCGSTVYCFQMDRCNSIVSGTQDNGRVVLWDSRHNSYVQMYYLDSCRDLRNTSPIYALSYDVDCLFAATDRHLTVLDFSIHEGKLRDYSNLFFKRRKHPF